MVKPRGGCPSLHRLPGEEEAALEGLLVPAGAGGTIARSTHGEAVARCDSRRVDRDNPPGHQLDLLGRQRLVDDRPALFGRSPGRKPYESKPLPLRHLGGNHGQVSLDDLVGQLGEQAGAVAGAVGRFGTAMVEPYEALDRQPQHPERGAPSRAAMNPTPHASWSKLGSIQAG